VLIRRAEVEGEAVDLRIRDGRIEGLAASLDPEPGDEIFEARGGALLPGLHDHHIHLFSLAAALESVRCGPPDVASALALERALSAAAVGEDGWIRGTGYYESVAGELDAARLDAMAPPLPVRIQHRSGALWVLNRTGLERIGLGAAVPAGVPAGVERDAEGRATGRLYRSDGWLREHLGRAVAPKLDRLGTLLASRGVAGVTDATPTNSADELRLFSAAIECGSLPLRLRVMGRPELPESAVSAITRGEIKLVLDESAVLDPAALAGRLRQARAAGRPTAIHCVTRTELLVALAAFEDAGTQNGDRIEHASVAPPELAERIGSLGITVVTQPNFIFERGDAYGRDVDAVDQPWLYRCQGLLDVGVRLGGGTDAPFGDPDPWRAMAAAVDRRTAAGVYMGKDEALSPEHALALFTSAPEAPGGAARRIAAGHPADLCLLDRSWASARDTLDREHVVATWSAGRLIFRRS